MPSSNKKQLQAILVIATRINPRLNQRDLEHILKAIGVSAQEARDAVGEAVQSGVLVWENQGYIPGQGLNPKKSH